jgi:hypothetical protein
LVIYFVVFPNSSHILPRYWQHHNTNHKNWLPVFKLMLYNSTSDGSNNSCSNNLQFSHDGCIRARILVTQVASSVVGGGRSKGSEPWSADGFSKSGVDPSGFANTNLLSETNQSSFCTHTMCRMASTRRCASCGISSSPVWTMRLKQRHTETLGGREIYDLKK